MQSKQGICKEYCVLRALWDDMFGLDDCLARCREVYPSLWERLRAWWEGKRCQW